MTEAEARAALRAHDGVGGLEPWIADQPWHPTPGGWQHTRGIGGWRCQMHPTEDGLRLTASAPGGGAPAVWQVAAVAPA
jgi:hypothetical protein